MNQSNFIKSVRQLGIDVTSDKLEKLEKYYQILIESNKVMNLTGITDHDEVYLKHFYDSLTIVKAVNLNNVDTLCDVGSGAGFPGMVLKIFYPNLKIVLIDSLNKRIKFLNRIIKDLNLKNIEAIHERIEVYSKNNPCKYDVVTARAVAPLNILLELSISLVKIDGCFIAMKGNISNEVPYNNALKKLNCYQKDIIEFKLPIENSKRSLIKIEKKAPTSKLFPRKYNDIKRNPL